MKIPNYKNAQIDVDKLINYCLNLNHPRGKHKALVFQRSLGFIRSDAEKLRNILLSGLFDNEVIELGSDKYGSRYSVDIEISNDMYKAMVRTLWIIRNGEDYPRLITCYVL